ncbi:YdeI/OmpD-associated family protein [Yoonia sp. SS1-5]|uniref:YdeI family protein n=1 Tax=Yoonia rhodophyticola TaxID=3137370 RepID=A0AAN0MB44_9RHOB
MQYRDMITEIEDYFTKGCGRCDRFGTPACSARHWADGLHNLREICRAMGLSETVKWGHPCYMHAGRNIVIIGAFRNDFRLSFFNASLMQDPDGILEKRGPNTAHPDMICFHHAADVTRNAKTIRAYLAEAMDYAARGIRPVKDESDLELPTELVQALDDDPILAEAFHALTRGRQKSYVINLNGAKQSKTRLTRIAKFRDKIIAGKGALDR